MRAVPVSVVLLLVAFLAPVASAYKETDHLDSTLSTHQFIMDHLAGMLAADGHPELADRLSGVWLDQLKWGAIEADRYLWRQGNHYMSPVTHGGLPGFMSAGDLSEQHFAQAVAKWADGDDAGALLQIGWAMEPMQDLTEPHHAHLDPFNYHETYEDWVLAHQTELPAATTGIYELTPEPGHYGNGSRPWDWVDYAAHQSYDLYPYVAGPDGGAGIDYRGVASEMIPLAEALSAGFLYRMLERLDALSPNAVAGPNSTAFIGGAVALDGSGSTDDIAIHAYEWRLPGNVTVAGPIATFRPTALGTYPAELLVTDAFGKTSTATTWVRVVPPPVAVISAPREATAGESASFDGSGSVSDVAIVRYLWDFGDGSSAEGSTATHAYSVPGTYTITLSVWDAAGRRAESAASIRVTPAPIAPTPESKLTEELILVFLAVASALVVWASARYGRMLRGEDVDQARRAVRRRR